MRNDLDELNDNLYCLMGLLGALSDLELGLRYLGDLARAIRRLPFWVLREQRGALRGLFERLVRDIEATPGWVGDPDRAARKSP